MVGESQIAFRQYGYSRFIPQFGQAHSAGNMPAIQLMWSAP